MRRGLAVWPVAARCGPIRASCRRCQSWSRAWRPDRARVRARVSKSDYRPAARARRIPAARVPTPCTACGRGIGSRCAARRAEQLGFPQGPVSLAYTRLTESWIRIETVQLERAAALVAEMIEQAERHGLDVWQLAGATWQAVVGGLAASGVDRRRTCCVVGSHRDPDHARRHLAHAGAERLYHRVRRRPRAGVERRRPTRAGPRLSGHHAGAGPRYRDVFLRRRTAAAARPQPHRPRRAPKPISPPPASLPAARARPCSNYAPPSTISNCADNPPAQ